jgi:hypothetical protein
MIDHIATATDAQRIRRTSSILHLEWSTAYRLLYSSFALLSVIYGLVTPVFEASDESRHFAVIDYIRHGGGLPVQHPGEISPWMQEGSQPPLYYALAIAVSFWVDTSDLPLQRSRLHRPAGRPGQPQPGAPQRA